MKLKVYVSGTISEKQKTKKQTLYKSENLPPYKTRVICYNINLNPNYQLMPANQRGHVLLTNCIRVLRHFLLCKCIYIIFISNLTHH